jgi:Tfp pilus assembly protein PilF
MANVRSIVIDEGGGCGIATSLPMGKRTWIVVGSLVLLVLLAAIFRPGKERFSGVPFIPKSEAQVLQKLTGKGDPREREIEAMRRELAADPNNRSLAVRLARRDIDASRATMDPRYLGRAQAALAPWWDLPDAPEDVLILRATIRQSLHDFEGALTDLDRALASDPSDAQSWITRATVLSVRGQYDQAKASCAHLQTLAGALVNSVCADSIASLTGDAKGAYQRLHARVEDSRASPAERSWALSTLGEIAARSGDEKAAEADFKITLSLDPSDAYTRAAYADLLIDEKRDGEVAALLEGRENDDNSLLRMCIAEKHLGKSSDHPSTLRARYAASRERGDVVHRREQARFALSVDGDAKDALTLARDNWNVQKEPWDARIFMESALAAHDANAAMPVADFLEKNHAEDPRLVDLVKRVRQEKK